MNEGNQREFSLPLLRAGNRAEIARLVDAYSTNIYRLALKMLANPHFRLSRSVGEGVCRSWSCYVA